MPSSSRRKQVSPRFTMQQVSTVYYGWGATTGDVNNDGNLDVVSGPFYYVGSELHRARGAIATGRSTTPRISSRPTW